MISSMYHTGFVVRDHDRAVAFYRDIIGMNVDVSRERQGPAISQVIGYDNAHLKISLLSVGGTGHVLELIQYVYPPSMERPNDERNVFGGSHIAFYVNDIKATYEDLGRRGARGLNPPTEVAPGRSACYLQDPDGNWVELVEDLN